MTLGTKGETMLSNFQGKALTEPVRSYVVFDLETTGTHPSMDDIIEISAVKVIEGQVVGEFSQLVNPGRSVPVHASMVNNIYDHMLVDQPPFEEVLPRFLSFIEDLPLVGHNISCFDLKFMNRETKDQYGKCLGNNYIDTLNLSRKALPKLSHHKLVDLAAHYGFDTEGAHRALADCHMNQKVYEALVKDLAMRPKTDNGDRKVCPRCGKPMKIRSGRYGEFWGCWGYPDCRYTENIR